MTIAEEEEEIYSDIFYKLLWINKCSPITMTAGLISTVMHHRAYHLLCLALLCLHLEEAAALETLLLCSKVVRHYLIITNVRLTYSFRSKYELSLQELLVFLECCLHLAECLPRCVVVLLCVVVVEFILCVHYQPLRLVVVPVHLVVTTVQE